jgi:Fe-S-cluster containining protein
VCENCGFCCKNIVYPLPENTSMDGLFLLKTRNIKLGRIVGEYGKVIIIPSRCKYLKELPSGTMCTIHTTFKPDICHNAKCIRGKLHVFA